jgi:hypothetical protein
MDFKGAQTHMVLTFVYDKYAKLVLGEHALATWFRQAIRKL